MAEILVMPKLGLTMTKGKVSKWLKKEGDFVKTGEDLYEVETEKLTNTVESTVEGTLLKIVAAAGETVACLAPVAVIGQEGEAIPDLGASPAADQAASKPSQETGASQAPAAAPAKTGERVIAAPAAKKLAAKEGVDLSQVSGSGPQGRITLKDVEAFLQAPQASDTGKSMQSGEPLASGLAKKIAADKKVDLSSLSAHGRIKAADVHAAGASQREETVPMSAMRMIISQRMRESVDISPTVSYDISVDVSSMNHMRKVYKSEDLKISYTDILALVVSQLLLEYPLLNCSVEDSNIVYKHYINLGIAVALPDGLLVPVIFNAHTKGLLELSAEIRTLAQECREGRISPDALTGGTFTITNLGMFGIESFTPIINQPEVAILGVNAIQDMLVVIDDEPVIRPIMKLSLVADHRAVDGSVAADFLARLKKTLEKPSLLLR